MIMMLHIRMKKETKGRDREERRKAGDNDVAYQNERRERVTEPNATGRYNIWKITGLNTHTKKSQKMI